MATKESVMLVNPEATKKRVEFFASSLDAFLQDFLEKANESDHLGALVAAARVAQMAGALSQEYLAIARRLAQSETEVRAAQQATKLVCDMVNRNGEQIGLEKETVPASAPSPDSSFN